MPTAIFNLISHRSAWFAVAALILIAVAGITAIRPLRCRPLASLATVTLVISLGSLVTYSSIPVHYTSLRTLSYLIVLLFPVGVLSWLVVGSWAVLMAGLISRRLAAAGRVRTRALAASQGATRWAAGRAVWPGSPPRPWSPWVWCWSSCCRDRSPARSPMTRPCRPR